MKKFVQLVSASVVGLSMMAGVAGADPASFDCSIVNTGADSTNECKEVNDTNLTFKCKNDVDVVFINNQNAGSGSVTVTENTETGQISSGDVQNVNSTEGKLNITCGPAVAATTPTTPAVGGQGGEAPAASPAAAPAAPKVVSLPKTGNTTLVNDAVIGVAIVGGTLAATQFGLATYRRLALK